MVRFCFASVWGHRLANSKEVSFDFQNQLMLGVLIFLLCPKGISDWIAKTCPIYCKIDSQVHALIELS